MTDQNDPKKRDPAAYDSDSIKILKGLEAVRKRPGIVRFLFLQKTPSKQRQR